MKGSVESFYQGIFSIYCSMFGEKNKNKTESSLLLSATQLTKIPEAEGSLRGIKRPCIVLKTLMKKGN